MPQSLQASHSKPRRVRTTPQQPRKQGHTVHAKTPEDMLSDRQDAQGPAKGSSHKGIKKPKFVLPCSQTVSQNGTVGEKRSRGTVTELIHHMVVLTSDLKRQA